jgi:hypothetical protein
MITAGSNETSTTGNVLRLRVGLHPGHIQYRLMSTQPNPAGNVGTVGAAIASRYGTKGNYQMYKGLTAEPAGKTAGSITGPFTTQWSITKLGSLLGLQFLAGGTYAPVETQSVPYSINGYSGPSLVVPMNP